MKRAYLLIQTQQRGFERLGRIAQEISALPGVLEAKPVSNPYDVIVVAEVPLDFAEIVIAISRVEGVYRVLVCPITSH